MLGVPIIVEWSVFTLPQEVAVCKWVLNRCARLYYWYYYLLLVLLLVWVLNRCA